MSDPRNFLLNTDYPTDMLVGRIIDSTLVKHADNMSDSVYLTIPHGLSYAPLVVGLYTDIADFSVYYKIGSSPQFYFAVLHGYTNRISCTVESDSTNVYINLLNFDTERQFYYRVSMLAPDGAGETPLLSPNLRQNLYIDTDRKIMNIHLSKYDVYNIVNNTLNLTIPHNLGYIPMALCWTSTDRVRQMGNENAIGVSGVDAYYEVDESNLYISVTDYSHSNIGIHYRIYK